MDNDIQAALSKMREEFIVHLPDRLELLKTLLAAIESGHSESLEELHRAAHNLVGSAGVHQLMMVSAAARNLEQIVAAIPADGMLDEHGLDVMRNALANLEAQAVNPGYAFVPHVSERRIAVPRIVVVDDDREQAAWLCVRLEQAGYQVDIFHELAAFAASSLIAGPPSVLIMGMMFSGSDDADACVIAKLKENSLNGFPVIFISDRQDMTARLAAYRSGATRYLTQPVDIDALLRVVAESAALTPKEPFRVLLVDDDAEQLAAQCLIMRQAGMTVLEAGDPFKVPALLENFAAEVLVLDMVMPECSGPELAAVLRDDDRYAQTPIVYLSAETCVSRQLLAMNRGGDHFLAKPVDPRHLVATVTLHARRFRQARQQAESLRAMLYERERQQQALDAHAIVSAADVAERRQIGDALRDSEERLRRSQLYAKIGTWDWNIQTGKLICSEHIDTLFGFPETKQENTYKNFFNNIHPDDQQQVSDAIEACLQQGVKFNIEFRCVWPDGSVRWLLERGDVVRDRNGAPLNMLGVVQDITKRKLAELQSLEQQSRLVIFKHIIENVVDGVITIDPAGIIRSFNPGAEKLFGYSAAEVINRNVSLLMPEPYRSEHAQYLARHMTGHPASIIGRQVELSGQHKDGTIFPMELAVTEMDIDQSKHFVGILRDIRERKQYEQEIIVARDAAERANNAKSEFLSSMSHELRTPMNAILGFGQLLEIDAELTEEQADYVDEILKAGHHLLELINEVLDLSRIESGTINLSMESLSCAELVSECLALVKPIAQGLGIIINNTTIGGYVIRADRTRIKQVLLNLLSNAIKYNRPQGEVSIQVIGQDGWVRLAVSDTGYGISAARRQEVFQPFSRLGAEDTDIEGTGIGLTISRRLMEMMGGTIDMKSKEGRGSTFWIELPEVVSGQGALSDDSEQAVTAGTGSDGECRYTVLYIEDNPANLRLVAQILGRNRQLQLITAHTPELGLELASARHPELILLDINLPGMDGYQVLSVLRSLDSAKKTPVIAISANATPRDTERGMAAGFDEYITKPIDVVYFLEAVNRLLPDCTAESVS